MINELIQIFVLNEVVQLFVLSVFVRSIKTIQLILRYFPRGQEILMRIILCEDSRKGLSHYH